MKHNRKLIDLSLFSGAVITLACLSLLLVGAGLASASENPIEMVVTVLAGTAPSIAAFWYFWWKSPTLFEQGIAQGKKHIARQTLGYETFYDTRYRENIIFFYDKTKPYDKNDRKSPNRITVQATKRNLKLLDAWLAKTAEK